MPQSLVRDLDEEGIYIHDTPSVEVDFDRQERSSPSWRFRWTRLRYEL